MHQSASSPLAISHVSCDHDLAGVLESWCCRPQQSLLSSSIVITSYIITQSKEYICKLLPVELGPALINILQARGSLTLRRKLNQRERHPRSKLLLNPLHKRLDLPKGAQKAYRLCEYSQSRLTIRKAMSSYGGPALKWSSTVSSFPGSLTILYVGAFDLSMRSG